MIPDKALHGSFTEFVVEVEPRLKRALCVGRPGDSISFDGYHLAAIVTATGMVLGIVSLIVLTALELGTPDPMYGDYPIAWTASYTAAALGGALGSFLMSRVATTMREPVPTG